MTPLIDRIERAFIEAREDAATHGGEITTTRIVQTIEIACKADDLTGAFDGVVDTAYAQARLGYGQAWPNESGHVAELVMDGLTDWIIA